MSDPLRIAVLSAGALLLAGSGWASVVAWRHARSAGRLWRDEEAAETAAATARGPTERLRRWLALAGLRGPAALQRFGGAVALSALAGGVLALAVARLPAMAALRDWAEALPILGPAFAPLLAGLPLFVAAGALAAPFAWVRARRRARVDAVEADLPLALELLATLSEAGLGFDAALERLLAAQGGARPLAHELRGLQRDASAGLRRSEALRRFAARLEIPIASSVVSALVQAEETGAGIAGVLRPLADELRARRRERELARVEALPNKLVVALVVGFLPGLLFWTLGPSFHQLFAIIDSITGG